MSENNFFWNYLFIFTKMIALHVDEKEIFHHGMFDTIINFIVHLF